MPHLRHARWAAACLLAGLAASASARPLLSDAELTRMLPGSWIAPSDSSDFTPNQSREVFRADGTYDFIEYADPACTKVARTTRVQWSVKDGKLVSVLDDGTRIVDEILDAEAGRLVLRTLDEARSYTRIRSEDCQGQQRR